MSEGGLVYEVCIVGETSLTYVLLMASYVILLLKTPSPNLRDMTFAKLAPAPTAAVKIAIIRIMRFCNGRRLCIRTRAVIVLGHTMIVVARRKAELASSWEATCLGKLFLQFQIFIDRYMSTTIS